MEQYYGASHIDYAGWGTEHNFTSKKDPWGRTIPPSPHSADDFGRMLSYIRVYEIITKYHALDVMADHTFFFYKVERENGYKRTLVRQGRW